MDHLATIVGVLMLISDTLLATGGFIDAAGVIVGVLMLGYHARPPQRPSRQRRERKVIASRAGSPDRRATGV